VTKTIKYIISPKVFTKKINNKTLILKEGEDFYRELNEAASLIWESIRKKKNITSIVDLFMKTYTTDENTAKKDIKYFIENYVKLGLLIKG